MVIYSKWIYQYDIITVHKQQRICFQLINSNLASKYLIIIGDVDFINIYTTHK